jgi:tRNA 2-thiouridine synthesizing protein A
MTERAPECCLDLRGTPCPLNWVKTKLRLEEMEPGRRIEVIVDQGNPERNVPRSAKMEGHRIVHAISQNGAVRICIERAEESAP